MLNMKSLTFLLWAQLSLVPRRRRVFCAVLPLKTPAWHIHHPWALAGVLGGSQRGAHSSYAFHNAWAYRRKGVFEFLGVNAPKLRVIQDEGVDSPKLTRE